MKNVIPFFLFTFVLLIGCSKDAKLDLDTKEDKTCYMQNPSRVEYQEVNVDGTENFYYLVLMDKNGVDLKSVYSPNIPSKFQTVGTLIDVVYTPAKELHKYVVCLAGHQIDPANPDYSEMGIVDLCEVTETKN